jgi:origin recognition complex subunit 3
LYGAQFYVERTESVLESVFQKVIAGVESPLRLGPEFVSNMIERQHDHVQSVQAFTAALKVTLELSLGKSQILTDLVYIHVPLLRKSFSYLR